jgi:hypothetical protein
MKPMTREWVAKAEGDFDTPCKAFRRAARAALGLKTP